LGHGNEDRIASIRNAAAVADQLSANADVEFQTVGGGRHAVLRHGRRFDKAADDFAARTLLAGS